MLAPAFVAFLFYGPSPAVERDTWVATESTAEVGPGAGGEVHTDPPPAELMPEKAPPSETSGPSQIEVLEPVPDDGRPRPPLVPPEFDSRSEPEPDWSSRTFAANDPALALEYVRVKPPSGRGIAWFVVGGIAGTTLLVKRTICVAQKEGLNCDGGVRGVDFSAYALGITSFSAAGYRAGRYHAYHDALSGRPRPSSLRAREIAGAVLFGAGLLTVTVDVSFSATCWFRDAGPYAYGTSQGEWCGSEPGVFAGDIGATIASTGGALPS